MNAPAQAARLDLAHLRRLAEFRFQLRRFLHFSQQAAEQAGLRPQQFQMLQCVAAMPEGVEPTIANVAERMFLSTIARSSWSTAPSSRGCCAAPRSRRPAAFCSASRRRASAFWLRWPNSTPASSSNQAPSWCAPSTAVLRKGGAAMTHAAKPSRTTPRLQRRPAHSPAQRPGPGSGRRRRRAGLDASSISSTRAPTSSITSA